jgi:hypothetical protein
MTRRKKRRFARKLFSTAAKDLGVSKAVFASMLLDKDEEALAAIAAAKAEVMDKSGPLIVSETDWEEILAIIMQIAEILMMLLPFFI